MRIEIGFSDGVWVIISTFQNAEGRKFIVSARQTSPNINFHLESGFLDDDDNRLPLYYLPQVPTLEEAIRFVLDTPRPPGFVEGK